MPDDSDWPALLSRVTPTGENRSDRFLRMIAGHSFSASALPMEKEIEDGRTNHQDECPEFATHFSH